MPGGLLIACCRVAGKGGRGLLSFPSTPEGNQQDRTMRFVGFDRSRGFVIGPSEGLPVSEQFQSPSDPQQPDDPPAANVPDAQTGRSEDPGTESDAASAGSEAPVMPTDQPAGAEQPGGPEKIDAGAAQSAQAADGGDQSPTERPQTDEQQTEAERPSADESAEVAAGPEGDQAAQPAGAEHPEQQPAEPAKQAGEEPPAEADEPEQAEAETQAAEAGAETPDQTADTQQQAGQQAQAAEQGQEAEGPKSDKMDWYILKVQSNREDSIAAGLRRRIKIAGLDYYFGKVIVPTETVTEFKGGKKRVTKRKLYPGYLVVQMEVNDDTWFLVRETPGIGDFTGAGGKPTPLLPHEVERLLARQEDTAEQAPKLKIAFNVGDRVKINEGTFENFQGEVSAIDETNGRVTVMINIFGRSTPVEVEYWQVEAV